MSVVHGDHRTADAFNPEIAELQDQNNKLQSDIHQLNEKISTLEGAVNQNASLQVQVEAYNDVSEKNKSAFSVAFNCIQVVH